MHIEKIVAKIEEELKFITGLKKINIHIENVRDRNSKPTYVELEVDKSHEKTFFKISSQLTKIITNNSPYISITYNNPHPHHSSNNLKRFTININETLTKPEERGYFLKQAAQNFYGVLKRWAKYGDEK